MNVKLQLNAQAHIEEGLAINEEIRRYLFRIDMAQKRLKKKVRQAKKREIEAKKEEIEANYHKVLNKNQISFLESGRSATNARYDKETVNKMHNLMTNISSNGCLVLRLHGYPLPSLRTYQKHMSDTRRVDAAKKIMSEFALKREMEEDEDNKEAVARELSKEDMNSGMERPEMDTQSADAFKNHNPQA